MKAVAIKTLECKQCGHVWVPRKAQVWICPKCKTPKWDAAPKAS